MSTKDTFAKQYIERSVQTDILAQIVTPPSPTLSTRMSSVLSRTSDSVAAGHSPSPSHSRSSTQFDIESAYSQTTDGSSPTHSFSTTARTYKRQQIAFNRPSKPFKIASTRLVSLPETVSAFSTKSALQKTARVVSMPTSLEDPSLLSDDFDLSAHSGEPFISEDEEGSRVRVHSHATDTPHTPSPPSSPESILIIANKNSLSEGFLRHNIRIEETSTPHPDNEGWISWANSPPRPIPALHGPLSLPYARCPSGAEGTIIDEQDHLPRIIWGLEGEDNPSSRPRSEAVPSPQYAPNPLPSHSGHSNVPPRFQNANVRIDVESGLRTQKHNPQELKRTPVTATQPKVQIPGSQPQSKPLVLPQSQQEIVRYPLRGQEPIDLSTIMHQQAEVASTGYHSDYDFYRARAVGSLEHDLHVHDIGRELGIDWTAALLAQENMRKSGYLSSTGSHSLNDHRDNHKSSTLSGASPLSLEYLASSHSPIVLEPPSQVKSRSTAPHRPSALEIAQQYRQQQLQQQHQHQQSLLPTPPNSSSPIWSSHFSPYQDTLISPELLSVPRLSKLSPIGLQSNTAFLHPEVTQQLRSSLQDRSHASGLLGRKGNSASLALPARIEDDPVRVRSLLPDGSNTVVSNTVSSYLHSQTRKQRSTAPASHVDRSPTVPRPPPNTPLSTVSSPSTAIRNNHTQTQIPMATPPSPTSPKPRLRSITQQHARSIPLARLVQRRLSSVPEEDAGTHPDLRTSSSPVPSLAQRARSYSSGESPVPPNVMFLLSPPSPLHVNTRSPSPIQPSQSNAADRNEAGFLDVGVGSHATVKLPGGGRADRGRGVGLSVSGSGSVQHDSKKDVVRGQENHRGRGSRKGGRGRKGRGGGMQHIFNGSERVDGGLMVKS
ncbi:hypothetical protein BKA93DRAFT_820793 [Sparassis latifolia]